VESGEKKENRKETFLEYILMQ